MAKDKSVFLSIEILSRSYPFGDIFIGLSEISEISFTIRDILDETDTIFILSPGGFISKGGETPTLFLFEHSLWSAKGIISVIHFNRNTNRHPYIHFCFLKLWFDTTFSFFKVPWVVDNMISLLTMPVHLKARLLIFSRLVAMKPMSRDRGGKTMRLMRLVRLIRRKIWRDIRDERKERQRSSCLVMESNVQEYLWALWASFY